MAYKAFCLQNASGPIPSPDNTAILNYIDSFDLGY
jgi:hypothetical protein